MRRLIVISLSILLLSACTHKQVVVKEIGDDKLTCAEISTQSDEVKKVLNEIDESTGFSGRNVGMGLLFWPGIFVNQMNASDARKAANDRLVVLADLSQKKNCN